MNRPIIITPDALQEILEKQGPFGPPVFTREQPSYYQTLLEEMRPEQDPYRSRRRIRPGSPEERERQREHEHARLEHAHEDERRRERNEGASHLKRDREEQRRAEERRSLARRHAEERRRESARYHHTSPRLPR